MIPVVPVDEFLDDVGVRPKWQNCGYRSHREQLLAGAAAELRDLMKVP
jgi:hypothetical protein